MSIVDISSPLPEHSHPSSVKVPNEKIIENLNDGDDDDRQARDAFLQHFPAKQHYSQRYARKSNTNYASSIGSLADRTPSSLLELKQQRLIAAADRKNRIIARIVSIVGLLIILLCAAIVTLTLKMAPKIDELVRTKTGAHHLVHIVSRMASTTTTASSSTTLTVTTMTMITTTSYPDNQTLTNSLMERLFLRTKRRSLI